MIQRHDGWMFLSHSNKDFELVRQIRNTLEDHGFRPITFFLKCVTDGDELDGLIKREIAARRWFVFVDSEHSRDSKWAQAELAYAKQLPEKTIYTIDAAQDYLPQLQEIMRRSRVYLSFSHRDTALAQRIRKKLIDNDFQVWIDDGLAAGADWISELTQRIDEACIDGFVLPIITKNFLESRHCAEELFYTLQREGMLIPVYFGMHSIPPSYAFLLSHVQGIWLDTNPSDEDLVNLVEALISFEDRRQS